MKTKFSKKIICYKEGTENSKLPDMKQAGSQTESSQSDRKQAGSQTENRQSDREQTGRQVVGQAGRHAGNNLEVSGVRYKPLEFASSLGFRNGDALGTGGADVSLVPGFGIPALLLGVSDGRGRVGLTLGTGRVVLLALASFLGNIGLKLIPCFSGRSSSDSKLFVIVEPFETFLSPLLSKGSNRLMLSDSALFTVGSLCFSGVFNDSPLLTGFNRCLAFRNILAVGTSTACSGSLVFLLASAMRNNPSCSFSTGNLPELDTDAKNAGNTLQ